MEEDTQSQLGIEPEETASSIPTFNEATIGLYSPLISDFSGDSSKDVSVHSFIRSLEEIAQSCKWPDLVKQWILKSKLKGKAALFYEQRIEQLTNRTFADIKHMLIKQFSKTENIDVWKALMECRCLVGEKVEDYSRRLLKLQDNCNAKSQDRDGSFIGDGKVLEIFLRGIPANIQEHMITITPKDIFEAIWWCKTIETKLENLPKGRSTTMLTQVQDELEDSGEDTIYSLAGLSIVQENPPARNSTQTHENRTQRYAKNTKITQASKRVSEQNSNKVDVAKKVTDERLEKATKKIMLRDSTTKDSIEMNRSYRNKHTISLKIKGKTIKCLLDPASDLTLVSRDTVSHIGLLHKIVKTKPMEIASALNGKSISTQSIDLYFSLPRSSCNFAHTFRVMQTEELLNYNAIIGIDFILANNAIIDYNNLKVHMWGEEVADLEPVKGDPRSLDVIHCNPVIGDDIMIDGEAKILKKNTREQPKEETAQLMVFSVTNDNIGDDDKDYMNIMLKHTNTEGKQLSQLEDILKEYKPVFAPNSPKLGIMTRFEHTVKLTDETPIKMPQYQIPVSLRSQVKQKLEEYVNSDIIEKSTSPWNLPMIVRQKKGGDIRLVLDATAVNKKTNKIDYPIFRIDDTFTKLKGKAWFSNIDLKAGYHQVMLAPQSRKYFAFKTEFGKYQYRRLPMGASNSGLYFQMVMEKILSEVLGDSVIVYQDDILIATATIDEHLKLLKKILDIFTREGIQINVKKSRLAVQEVKFLGHVLGRDTYSPMKENTDALSLLTFPKTKKQLRSFLGRINFYARFVPALSHMAAPLTDMLSCKGKSLEWSEVHENAFRELKKCLMTEPILHYPDYDKKFIISIQVSATALIGVLEQGEEEERYPIGYFSKKLNKAQQNYSPLEKNALAVVTVLEHFNHLISGYKVDVCTSRKAVEYLRSLRDGSTRITDWILKISKYAPNFVFNNNSTAITHILDLEDIVLDDADIHKKKIPTAYTDGSCVNSGKKTASSGIGVCWKECDIPSYSGSEKGCDTNNKAELAAIIMALKMGIKAGFEEIKIISDSKYAIENITTNMPNWEINGWKSAKQKPIENLEDFKCIKHLLSLISVIWEHVPGHSKNPGNDSAHELAMNGRVMREGIEKEVLINEEKEESAEILAIRTKGNTQYKIPSDEEIKRIQETDTEIARLIEQNGDHTKEPDMKSGVQLYLKEDRYVYAKGIIKLSADKSININSIYIPSSLRSDILTAIHNSKWVNHAGYIKMCELTLERYYWDNFRRDIRSELRCCDICQKSNITRQKPKVLDFEKPTRPGCKVALDIVGPIISSHTGNKYILTIVDMFSRHLTVCALKGIKVEDVLYAIEKDFITIYGVPEYFITDRGSNFRAEIFEQTCKVLKIKHYMTTPYHPASNGLVERLNKEIKKKLTSLCNGAGKSWDTKLHLVQFAINNSYHSALNTSPNIITFGENRRFPDWSSHDEHLIELDNTNTYVDALRERLDDIRELAWAFENNVRQKRNEAINRKRILPRFQVDDLVLHRSVRRGKNRNHGFSYIYDGPFKITKKISDMSYEIGLEHDTNEKAKVKRVHAERLKPYLRKTTVVDDIDLRSVNEPDRRRHISKEEKPKQTDMSNKEDEGKTEQNGNDGAQSKVETNNETTTQVCLETDSDDVILNDEKKNETTEHQYFTRRKGGYKQKCYRNYHIEQCTCK